MIGLTAKDLPYGGEKACISNALDVDVVAEVNQGPSGLILQRLKRLQDFSGFLIPFSGIIISPIDGEL